MYACVITANCGKRNMTLLHYIVTPSLIVVMLTVCGRFSDEAELEHFACSGRRCHHTMAQAALL